MIRILSIATVLLLAGCSEAPKAPSQIGYGFLLAVEAEGTQNQSDLDLMVKRITVNAIVCNGPAHEKGLEVGNTIRSVDGHIVTSLTIHDYLNLEKRREVGIATDFVVRDESSERLVRLVTREVGNDLTCGIPKPGRKI